MVSACLLKSQQPTAASPGRSELMWEAFVNRKALGILKRWLVSFCSQVCAVGGHWVGSSRKEGLWKRARKVMCVSGRDE